MQKGPDVSIAVVEAADHIEDEGLVRDNLPERAEVIGHLLQAPTVVGDREMTLDEVVKPHLKMHDACLPVAEDLRFHGKPGIPGDGTMGGDDFSEVIGEPAEDRGLDHAIHAGPIRGHRDGSIDVDVILGGRTCLG